MAEFALAVPFPALVDKVGVPNDLPPHVTLRIPCSGVAEVLEPLLPLHSRVESVVVSEHAYGGL